MILQPLLDIAELCVRRGITQAVIAPGSRSAALTLAFARHPSVQTKVIPDERAAAYLALGMAQQLGKPVVLICTSGTAALNFAPAIAEAYFLGVPLLVLTADRPPEWIHQQDGQMIHQDLVYGKHVKEAATLPTDYAHADSLWFIERMMNQLITNAEENPKGPVHLNVPIREPFYPKPDEIFAYGSPRVIIRSSGKSQLPIEVWEELLDRMESTDRVLILAGQQMLSVKLLTTLSQIREELGIPVVGEILSNLHGNFITHPDFFLASADAQLLENLQPELVISFGDAYVSKNLKLFLRKYKPKHHYHLTTRRELIDPFQSLTHQLTMDADQFFQELLETLDWRSFKNGDDEPETDYLTRWENAESKSRQSIRSYFQSTESFVEFKAIDEVMAAMPPYSQLHLANSMSVRYANFVGIQKNIQVFSNRGTSGIDGCLSTAVGAALTTDRLVFVLIGDVAFFYDRNALWHPYVPANLRIVLINNSGGSIFRMIEGPRQQPELETFFETRHQTSARNTAQDAGLDYWHVDSYEGLEKSLPSFILNDEKAKLLEISSDAQVNQNYFDQFKSLMKGI